MRDVHAALLCVVTAGCSYDWTVPAGAPADAAPQDTSLVDTAPDGAGPTDASTEPAGDVMSMPDSAEAASVCSAADEAPVQQALAAALDCTGITPNPCEVMVQDECGCEVVVAKDNQAEAQYVAAVQALLKMCTPMCPTACGSTPTEGLCVLSDAGSAMLACYQ
jgi:hypothetical protein